MELCSSSCGARLPSPRVLALLASALMLGACSQVGDVGRQTVASPLAVQSEADPAVARSDLAKATEYWGKEHTKNPNDLKAALSYARNLKAMDQKPAALEVMQRAFAVHGDNRELASEYGRLALELGQVAIAAKLLQIADDPAKPDWRILSARGTALAKQGQYAEAVPFFERANALAKGSPSVLNNLAMAYTATGHADKAEGLLRRAIDARPQDAKIRQNLAIVLSMQGRYDEAKQIGATGHGTAVAAADVDYLRRLVRLEPKQAPAGIPAATAVAGWTYEVSPASGRLPAAQQ